MTGPARSVVRAGGRDRGAVLILFALLLAALITMVAIVVDLGQQRVTKNKAQETADLAALAAGADLAYADLAGSPEAACESAWQSILQNITLPAGATMPCSQMPARCTAEDVPEPVTVTATGTGSYLITFTYPVTDAEIRDERFATGVGLNDGSTCERMRVEIRRTIDTAFGGIVGIDELTAGGSAVVRGTVEEGEEQSAALLMLERRGCGVLYVKGQGRIVVKAFDETTPGMIQTDSAGVTTGPGACKKSTTVDGYVVYGTELPQPVDGSSIAIWAQAYGEQSGRIFMYSMAVGSDRNAYLVPLGVYPAPRPGGVASRAPVDDKYDNPENPSGQAVTALHAEATALASSDVDGLRAAGYAVFPDDYEGASCTMTDPLTVTDPKVAVACDPLNARSLVFTGTDVVVLGRVSVGSNNQLRFPNARQVVIAGSTKFSGLEVQGTLVVNDGVTDPAVPPATCDSRTGTAVAPAQVVVVNGPLDSSTQAKFSMCQTFLYLADGGPPRASSDVTSAGCTPELPCPGTNTFRGHLSMFGTVDWSAPNQGLEQPTVANQFEDLALWTETSTTSEIKGQGATRTSGVFFFPNATFDFSGQASKDVDLDAQFIARRLWMTGQGTLSMMPNPANVVPIYGPAWMLIR
jgi:Tfp pilus assembly protein PilX